MFGIRQVIQLPGQVVMLLEKDQMFRVIYADGRPFPEDPQPSWLGYSVGHWEGDDLVVEVTGFNGESWLDYAGHPQTDALRLIERFSRRDFGHMRIQITIDDRKAYTMPWTVTEEYRFLPDADLLEAVCLENEKDAPHMVGK